MTHGIARETGANFFNISAKNLDPGPPGSGRIKYPDKKGPNSAVMMLHMVFKVAKAVAWEAKASVKSTAPFRLRWSKLPQLGGRGLLLLDRAAN